MFLIVVSPFPDVTMDWGMCHRQGLTAGSGLSMVWVWGLVNHARDRMRLLPAPRSFNVGKILLTLERTPQDFPRASPRQFARGGGDNRRSAGARATSITVVLHLDHSGGRTPGPWKVAPLLQCSDSGPGGWPKAWKAAWLIRQTLGPLNPLGST
jgi:hypothetical protein